MEGGWWGGGSPSLLTLCGGFPLSFAAGGSTTYWVFAYLCRQIERRLSPMKKLYYWIVNLYSQPLAEDKKNLIAKVQFSGNVADPEELARIAAEDYGTNPITALAHFNQLMQVAEKLLLSGRPVDDSLFITYPGVKGNWRQGQTYSQGVHKLGFIHKLDKAFKQKLQQVKVEVGNVRNEQVVARITAVQDALTHLTNDSCTVNKPLFIYGEKIKVIGRPINDTEDATVGASDASDASASSATPVTVATPVTAVTPVTPATEAVEPGVGVFFTPTQGGQTVQATAIYQNTPTAVQVEVPSKLDKNKAYTLSIVTRYTDSSAIYLKNLRTITYPHPITIN
jgi:hypothetical protein